MDINLSTQDIQAVLVVAFLFALIGLMVVVLRQKRRISKLEEANKPKYGFLGKPLMSFLGLFLLAGGIGLTYYASNNIQNVRVSADKQVEISINPVFGERQNGSRIVNLYMVPTVDNKQWGVAAEDKFNAFWTITGKTSFSDVEIELSKSNTGGIKKLLPIGEYEVKVEVVYDDRIWDATRNLVVPE